jgi:hypothetical protein
MLRTTISLMSVLQEFNLSAPSDCPSAAPPHENQLLEGMPGASRSRKVLCRAATSPVFPCWPPVQPLDCLHATFSVGSARWRDADAVTRYAVKFAVQKLLRSPIGRFGAMLLAPATLANGWASRARPAW